MQVHRIGVLIEGAPGSGKSALALELLARGHRLIADDVVVIRSHRKQLIGRCPPRLRGFIEVRGLGILDAKRMFGAKSQLSQTRIRLRLRLTLGRISPDRLRGNYRQSRLAGVALPRLSLSTTLGHNLAVFTEAACLDLRLRLAGHDALAALSRRR